MPQFGSYPVITTLADADLVMVAQDSSGSEKLASVLTLKDKISSDFLDDRLLFSQYEVINITGATAGWQNILTGSIRGTTVIPADRLVEGSIIRFKVCGYINTIGINRNFNFRIRFSGNVMSGDFLDLIAQSGTLSNSYFEFSGEATISQVGVTGVGYGQCKSIVGDIIYPQSNPSSTLFNTTASNLVSMQADWTGALAGDILTVTSVSFEII